MLTPHIWAIIEKRIYFEKKTMYTTETNLILGYAKTREKAKAWIKKNPAIDSRMADIKCSRFVEKVEEVK